MKNQGGVNEREQYVNTKYVQESLMVSRTKAYGIVKEIEETYAPGAVIRIGRCLRVRKDVFFHWVNKQGTGDENSHANAAVPRPQKDDGLRLAG